MAPYNGAMARNWMEERLNALSKTPADLTRALGLQKRTASVFEMLKGERKLQPREYVPAAKFFKMDLNTVIALATGKSAGQDPMPDNDRDHRMDTALPSLVVWKSGDLKDSRFGGFLLYSEKAGRTGRVRRPDTLDDAENAFAFKVIDNKHAPAYTTRDIALVDPDDPITEGDDCLFTDEGKLDSGVETIIGLLIERSPKMWTVRQHASPEQVQLSRADFPDAWRIIGRYIRR